MTVMNGFHHCNGMVRSKARLPELSSKVNSREQIGDVNAEEKWNRGFQEEIREEESFSFNFLNTKAYLPVIRITQEKGSH